MNIDTSTSQGNRNSQQTTITRYFSTDHNNTTNSNKNNQNQQFSNLSLVGNYFKDFIYLNARSILANLTKIQYLCKSLKPKIVFCSEARITHEINENEYAIDGYKTIVCHSHSRATDGVVAYILKKNEI